MPPDRSSRHELIPITEAAALIAEHVTFTNRATNPKKLIAQNIRDAAGLSKAKLHGKDAVYLDEVLRWAANKWPSLAQAYGISRYSFADLISSATVKDFMEMTIIPGDIHRCQEHLRNAHAELEELRSQIASLEAEIARLNPLAESRRKSDAGLEKGRKSLARAKK